MDIHQSQSLLTTTLNAIKDGIVIVSEHATIRLVNTYVDKLYGYSPQEIVGKPVSILLPATSRSTDTRSIKRFLTAITGNPSAEFSHVETVTKDGRIVPIHLSLGRFQHDDGTVFIAVLRDQARCLDVDSVLREAHNDSPSMREQLNKVSRSSMLTELVDSIAHEVNQPLSAIANYSAAGRHALYTRPPDLRPIEQVMQKINNQAIRASEVIDKLRELAKKAELPRERVSIDRLFQDFKFVSSIETHEGAALVNWRIEDNLPDVFVCRAQIQHVFQLLLHNALESTVTAHGNGMVIRVCARLFQNLVEVSIKDSGKGVTRHLEDKLYFPFTTDKAGRMGIGLAICSTIVQNHGGDIGHESSASEGSRFFFRLPILQGDTSHESL